MNAPTFECPFAPDDVVVWKKGIPEYWRYIHTDNPMTVVSARWHSGQSNWYADKFGKGGMQITPGWIIMVEYDITTSNYYEQPLSLFFRQDRIRRDVHQKWLRLLNTK